MLVFGKPTREPYKYTSFTRTKWGSLLGGVAYWLKETGEGRLFTQCVANAGEAKSRAYQFYNKYLRWYEAQEIQREKANAQTQSP